jgi:hypothetical protein
LFEWPLDTDRVFEDKEVYLSYSQTFSFGEEVGHKKLVCLLKHSHFDELTASLAKFYADYDMDNQAIYCVL